MLELEIVSMKVKDKENSAKIDKMKKIMSSLEAENETLKTK